VCVKRTLTDHTVRAVVYILLATQCLKYVADSVTELKKIIAFTGNLNRLYLTADVTAE
jgi:uncharacterized membrane protein SirB2